jgi:hypothetical protein
MPVTRSRNNNILPFFRPPDPHDPQLHTALEKDGQRRVWEIKALSGGRGWAFFVDSVEGVPGMGLTLRREKACELRVRYEAQILKLIGAGWRIAELHVSRANK